MAMLDYINKVVALPDGTKIGTIKDIERQAITQRFFALIALNPPHKGKTIKVPIGELRKIADNAFALSTQYAEGVKKEIYGEEEAVEIKPTSPPPSTPSRPLTPQISSLPPTRPPPKSPEPSSTPSAATIALQDAKVWSQISQQISGKKTSGKPPTPAAPQPSNEVTTPPPRQVQPPVSPPAQTPPIPPELNCPKCKKQVQSDFKFCPHCRTPLFCISCGYPILDRKWKACPSCGFIFPK